VDHIGLPLSEWLLDALFIFPSIHHWVFGWLSFFQLYDALLEKRWKNGKVEKWKYFHVSLFPYFNLSIFKKLERDSIF
jgi:hypothetical protein